MAGPAQQVSTPTATGAELSPSPSQSTQSDVCENVADKEEKGENCQDHRSEYCDHY